MGFQDLLFNAINSSMNTEDPLFGGLIPRRTLPEREERPVRMREDIEPRSVNLRQSLRQNDPLIPAATKPKYPYAVNPIEGKNIVFNWDEQLIKQRDKALALDAEKLKYARSRDEREFGLKDREQELKEITARDSSDIAHRKQALDEWKTMNPEGEIKVDKNGKIHVINKMTGQSIDTGLIGDDFDEEEKMKLQQKYNLDLEGVRQEGRMAVEKEKNKGRIISPGQQRVAEDDAFRELLNSGEFDDIKDYIDPETGEITPAEDSEGFLGFGKTDKQNTINVNNRIDEFKARLKEESEKRMGRTLNEDTGELEDNIVEMVAPDGRTLNVPKEEVDRLKGLGAKVKGEEEAPKETKNKPVEVRDDIELFYDANGKVIGARNKRPKKE